MPEVPELPPFDARSFTKRLHEKVRQTFGYVEVNGVRYPVKNESLPYGVFDPVSSVGFEEFVAALRGQQDVVERHEVQLTDQKDHIDRVDSREAAHHAAQDARLDSLEAAHRPFGSGAG